MIKGFFFSFLASLTCGTLFSLPVSNPSEASLFECGLFWDACCWHKSYQCSPPCWDAGSFRIGYLGDFVFDRHLCAGRDEDEEKSRRGLFESSNIHTNSGYFALNFCNRVDLFLTLGQSSFHTRQNTSIFARGLAASRGFESELWFKPAFSWSLGARYSICLLGPLAVGIEGQYFNVHPRIDYIVIGGPLFNGAKVHFNDLQQFHTRYMEWQASFGAAYRIPAHCFAFSFVPFAAVQYASVRWAMPADQIVAASDGSAFFFSMPDFHTRKHWGWTLGLSFIMNNLSGVTIEGRFANEKAFSIKGQVRF